MNTINKTGSPIHCHKACLSRLKSNAAAGGCARIREALRRGGAACLPQRFAHRPGYRPLREMPTRTLVVRILKRCLHPVQTWIGECAARRQGVPRLRFRIFLRHVRRDALQIVSHGHGELRGWCRDEFAVPSVRSRFPRPGEWHGVVRALFAWNLLRRTGQF